VFERPRALFGREPPPNELESHTRKRYDARGNKRMRFRVIISRTTGATLSYDAAPPGWYPDPGGGGQRYYDGQTWTGHVAAAAAYVPAVQPWKGARYGRPPYGPGSLSDPGKRFLARLLDGLVMMPVFIACVAVVWAIVAPHTGPLFPSSTYSSNASTQTPGFVWFYLAAFVATFIGGALSVAYETIATVRYGRTLGKRWMNIRPVSLEGHALGWGQSFGRALLYWIAGWLSWLGLLDYLWCIWDPNSQCVHDKIASTLVVND
jgi:uncharacterized RDD family membrane protein YckC